MGTSTMWSSQTRFYQKLSNLELWSRFWRPVGSRTWAFQRAHYWTTKIQDGGYLPSWKSTWRHFFLPRSGSDLDIILQTGAEWHVDCGDMVEIETRSRIPIGLLRTFGRIQRHVIPEPCATLQGAVTWLIQWRHPRSTCHIAGWKNSIRHIENRFSPYFIFLFS